MVNNMCDNESIIKKIVLEMSNDQLLEMVDDYRYFFEHGVYKENSLVTFAIKEIVSHGIISEEEASRQLQIEVLVEGFIRMVSLGVSV